MNHLDLFSGIGGFHLAGEMVWGDEFNTIAHVEIDKFCQKVLKKHWPDVPIHDDIRTYKHDGTTIDLLTGGFPCQPFSQAGKQRGEKDDRYLWPEMLRIISEVRPTWIVGENVAGIINLALDQVLSDLENEGYACQPFIIPACGKEASHQRDRVWIVSNSTCIRNNKQQKTHCGKNSSGKVWPILPDFADSWPKPWIEAATRLCRVDDGIPRRVDRLKSLGNAIVPQVVVPIMEAIKELSPNKASAEAHE